MTKGCAGVRRITRSCGSVPTLDRLDIPLPTVMKRNLLRATARASRHTLVVLLVVSGTASAQSGTDSLLTIASALSYDGLTAACGADSNHARTLAGLLRSIAGEQGNQGRSTFEVSAGLSSDEVPTGPNQPEAESHRADVGLALRRGTYPGELGFFAEMGVSLADGRFSENVSRLHTAYDHYINPFVEGYVFLDRLSDQFLSIDQRYEVGVGVVFDLHPLQFVFNRHEVTSRGQERLAKVRNHSVVTDSALVLRWLACLGEVNRTAAPGRRWSADSATAWRLLEKVRRDRQTAVDGIRKTTSRLRLALLLGSLAELERATITLSTTPPQSVPIPGTRTYRWSVRPTVVVRPWEAIALRVDYYWKPAFAGFREAADPRRDDYRRDIRIGLSADGDASGAGKLSATLEFRRLTDNAPPFTSSGDSLLVARRRHDRLTLRLGAKF